jgi:hypothetical protein
MIIPHSPFGEVKNTALLHARIHFSHLVIHNISFSSPSIMARFLHLLVFAGLLQVGAGAAIAPRSSEPKNPYDEKTSADCTWWFDMDAAISCTILLENEAITIEQFRRWVS